jgi:hypothetical protein
MVWLNLLTIPATRRGGGKGVGVLWERDVQGARGRIFEREKGGDGIKNSKIRSQSNKIVV